MANTYTQIYIHVVFTVKGKLNLIPNKHKIELYSGGELVRTWTSTDKVMSSSSSDGYYFRDSQCNCNVEVSGDVVITRIN